ncbi:MAG: glycosyltransferase [Blastocatellia bacterium]|nr:glycosyltransferase [Blastocatellia bacterium]MCS7157694.1 glycosyltransferase [Blastocatellia bacterium]MCX7751959.1 glycosyltransferase [Blastocatellia bacterium]MDW8167065.1 glycosyltransferase [Acidobacteriota bacterium]MDW8257169.1 glycosyltransferase [Acidobacteriota bacterium]
MNEAISIVIPTRNAGPEFPNVLERLLAQRTSSPLEIVVIDSGSTDGTVERCARFPVTVLSIPPEEFDHGETRDRAIHRTRGQFVALLVQDALPANEWWLERLIEPMRRDASIAGTYSRQVPRPGSDAFVRRHVSDHIASRPEPRLQKLESAQTLSALSLEEKIALFSFDNVSSAIRRSVWERFPFGRAAFGEDIRWAKRVMEAGYAIYYQPDSVVIHSHDRSAWYDFKRFVASYRLYHELFGGDPPSLWFTLFNAIPYNIYVNLFKLPHERITPRVIVKAFAKGLAFPLGRYLGPRVATDAPRWRRRLGDWLTRGI